MATRIGRSASDEPIRVEVIVREEIEEKAIMRPGNISMLVAETGGVRVQTTSPALGSANIRLQGLYGRYTQLLADGLPLYGGQAASIGLLQIPPTDLAHVEVIKGSASSLYGGSALGGVINLVSRRPGNAFEGEALVNLTTRDGQDLTTYVAAPLNPSFSASLTAGAHRQDAKDLDDDGWIDIAEYERVTARPRLFWTADGGARVYATTGFMAEERTGGTLPGRTVPDGSTFPQTQDTQRFDAGFIADGPFGDVLGWSVRGSAMIQDHDKRFGAVIESDRHESYLVESSLTGYTLRSNWVAGIALQSDVFDSDDFPAFDYSYEVPGLFGQLDYDLTEALSTSISARLDEHSEYGSQFSPRLSVLYRPGDWTIRGSYGQGYFAPTPFVEEIEAAGLSRLEPLMGLKEETAETASIDVGYSWGELETNATLFASNVDDVTRLQPFSSEAGGPLDRVRLINVPGESRIRGTEFLVRYYWRSFKLTGSYLYLDATEPALAGEGRRRIPLTPEHSAGFVAMWEQHGRGRLGFEAYYTGTQRLEDNPYRDESEPYWHLGLLGEITRGRASWFINFENLLNVRQTREDPLVRPSRAPSGQWTTDIWSRNDGFVVNGGVRVRFGD
ncbi:TonB-dependent receptor [Wenzhouxiangella sp. XN79A]|uniref:TonB-dependent receptor domain-containing protein n=1 Tax=Wenzhouxiangella sp. XN79A TaxID=2724193 RepID=UPI001980AC76